MYPIGHVVSGTSKKKQRIKVALNVSQFFTNIYELEESKKQDGVMGGWLGRWGGSGLAACRNVTQTPVDATFGTEIGVCRP